MRVSDLLYMKCCCPSAKWSLGISCCCFVIGGDGNRHNCLISIFHIGFKNSFNFHKKILEYFICTLSLDRSFFKQNQPALEIMILRPQKKLCVFQVT